MIILKTIFKEISKMGNVDDNIKNIFEEVFVLKFHYASIIKLQGF